MYDGFDVLDDAEVGFELWECDEAEWGKVLADDRWATAAGVPDDHRVPAHGGTAHRPSDEYRNDIFESRFKLSRPFHCW